MFNAVINQEGALGFYTLGSDTQDERLKPNPIFLAPDSMRPQRPRRSQTPAYFYTPLLPCGNDAGVAAVREPLDQGVVSPALHTCASLSM